MSNNGIAVHDHEHMFGAAPQSTEVSLDIAEKTIPL